MNIKIWDKQNKKWLEPMAIYFKDNNICHVSVYKAGDNPLHDEWYDIKGDDLDKIAIIGKFDYNTDLLK